MPCDTHLSVFVLTIAYEGSKASGESGHDDERGSQMVRILLLRWLSRHGMYLPIFVVKCRCGVYVSPSITL